MPLNPERTKSLAVQVFRMRKHVERDDIYDQRRGQVPIVEILSGRLLRHGMSDLAFRFARVPAEIKSRTFSSSRLVEEQDDYESASISTRSAPLR